VALLSLGKEVSRLARVSLVGEEVVMLEAVRNLVAVGDRGTLGPDTVVDSESFYCPVAMPCQRDWRI